MAIERSEWIWYSGEWRKWEDATLHVTAHALHYGSSAFQGIRAYDVGDGPAIFRLREHLQRLLASAKILRMDTAAYPLELLERASIELVSRNRHEACYIRPIAFRNSGSLGLDPTTCPVDLVMFSTEWGRYLGTEAIEQGVDVAVSSWRRFAPGTLAPLGKIGGQYVNNSFASIEAKANGFTEGLMLDAGGNLCEGAGENAFLVLGGEIWTPPLASSILGGITRDCVLTLAADLGIPVRFETISRDLLYLCDEMFLTGTAAEITPVRSVDRLTVGAGKPGPITLQLQERFFEVVSGRAEDDHGWLTSVPAICAPTARPRPALEAVAG